MRRWDWFLLPLIAVSTVLSIVGVSEIGARFAWAEVPYDRCMVQSHDNKPLPNCSDVVKTFEGPWVHDAYNECSNRSTGRCARLPPNISRLSVVGSSTSFGYLVPYDQTWSVVAAREVEARDHCKIDVQNMVLMKSDHSGLETNLGIIAHELPSVISLHPSMIALVISAYDLTEMPSAGFDPNGITIKSDTQPTTAPTLLGRLRAGFSASRTFKIMEHFMFRDSDRYIRLYLTNGDHADFLRPPWTPSWQKRLAYLDAAVAYIGGQLQADHIAMLVVYAPQPVQADIVGRGEQVPGVDAEALGEAIGDIVHKHGGVYADGLLAFKGKPDAADYFYLADGHPNGAGQSLLGDAAAQSILAAHQLCPDRTATTAETLRKRVPSSGL